MGVRLNRVLVGGLVAVSGPASAQSLINGEQLQYNYAYRCNGERIIVARCRDDSDSSYCQVVYPDRHQANGYQVAPVEMRGDIVGKLDACMRPRATSVASSERRANPPNLTKTVALPGVGKSSWSFLDMEDSYGEFFVRARIRRSGSSASGWFTTVYPEPKDFPDFGISGVQYDQTEYEANCAAGMMKMVALGSLDEEGKTIVSGPAHGEWSRATPGSRGQKKFNVLCGRPQPLADSSPVVGDGDYLTMYYIAMLRQKAREKH